MLAVPLPHLPDGKSRGPCLVDVRAIFYTKKPIARVSKRVPGVHGKRGLERGWQKRLAKGWRKVGEGLAKGWHRVGEGLADFLAPSNFGISRGAHVAYNGRV